MGKILVDTNIFIDIFKGNHDLQTKIYTLDCVINTIIYVELIQGAKDKSEVHRIEKYLFHYDLIHLSEVISKTAMDLIRFYSKSHGLFLADAFVAATCLVHEFSLLTFNTADFKFIKGLDIHSLLNE